MALVHVRQALWQQAVFSALLFGCKSGSHYIVHPGLILSSAGVVCDEHCHCTLLIWCKEQNPRLVFQARIL